VDTPPSFEQWVRDTFARRDEVLSRVQSEAQMATVLSRYREDSAKMANRISELEEWKSNLMGRAIAFTILGAILVAVCTSVITRLILG
jgi:hypothetical protein